MAAPSLTVLLSCYIVAPFLPACLHSLLAQPGANQLKVIVVDDGSTDGTLQARDAVALHPDMDCTIVTQANQGTSRARNAGIDAPRGGAECGRGLALFPSSGRDIGAVRREACWDVRDARGRP
jgi:glycosyltransferase involved in cell wall biosynthesis